MRFLRTNTAVIITVGPFYDATDGVTIETALTITNERITLTADTDAGSAPTNILDNVTGATSGTANDLNYITGNDAGMMQLELAAADTNRLGRMFLSITDAANHVPVFHEFMVLPAMIYDAFVLGTDVLDSSMTQILGTAVSTPATAGVLDVNVKNIDNDAASASGTVTFPNATLASTTNITAGTVTTATNVTTVNGLAAGVITAAAIADAAIDRATFAVDTGLQTIRSNTAAAGAAGSITFDAAASATDNFYRGNEIRLTGGTGSGQVRICTGYTGSTQVALVDENWQTNPDNTSTFAIMPLRNAKQNSSLEVVAASVTGAVGSVTGAVGSVTGNVGGNVTGSIGSLATQAKADVNAEADAALVDVNLDHLVGTATGIPALPANTFLDTVRSDGTATYDRTTDSLQAIRDAGATVTDIEDAVWDATLTDHLDSGSTGAALNAAGAAGDPWSTALPGAYGAGTAGKIVGDNVNATISSRASQTSVDTVDDFLDTEIADIRARLPAALVSGRIDASVGAMAANTLTAAAINADAITAAKIADGAIDAATFAANAITATVIADNAITAAKVADGTIDAATFAAGAIDATAIAANAIGASELAADAVQEIWDAATSALTTAGSVGKLLTDNVNATISSRLPTANITLSGGDVTVGTNKDKTGYRLSATGVDDILDEALTELAAVPAAAPALRSAMQFLYQALRNRTTTTATALTVQDDGGNTIATATLSDAAGTFTKGEFA